KGERKIRDLSLESTVSSKRGMHGVVGDRMVGSWSEMNQGSRAGKERRSWLLAEPEEPCPEGDSASVVARKRGNARGAKGGRKVETLNKSRKEADTVNVLWTQFGEEQRQLQTFRWRKMTVGRLGNERQPGSSLNDLWLRRSISSGVNHQLESRMQEICQSGSEGGAKHSFVPTPISAQAKAWAKFPRPFGPKPAPKSDRLPG